MSSTTHNKCARKMDHRWEEYKETKTHLIKECVYCKGHKWIARRN